MQSRFFFQNSEARRDELLTEFESYSAYKIVRLNQIYHIFFTLNCTVPFQQDVLVVYVPYKAAWVYSHVVVQGIGVALIY